MNTFILMAEVFTEPELRSTPDNQNEVSSFLVQFPGKNAEDTPARLKVTGWNNLAKEIIEKKYQKGDLLIIEGRLRINVIERNGYKEKVTELTAQRIHPIDKEISTPAKTGDLNRPIAPSPAKYAPPAASVIAKEDDIPF
ncbi:single-stranded DNA-binding protein [Synechococcus sp. PCC 7502]|uniref:single-stranded DNA-binding protein n=1 Tax=Synechococcus sp. PCC 7502 TaxID=1173263 RepID=UPI00029F9133|nr:single-stranded DNA-binding protein [Synechococcus sp. PCC 7502]AFY72768.1 single-stranded DNA-binding protein [Synechococcus sp. PCC 7502]